MQLTGKLIQLLPLQKGTGKNGEWKKQDIIIETQAQYPKKVCISIWGDKINESLLQTGKMLTVSFDVESREYNGRWYTDVKAWKIDPAGTTQADNSYDDEAKEAKNSYSDAGGEAPDDLPF